MPSLAQVSDLQTFVGQTLNTAQAQQVLNQATAAIQGFTGQILFQGIDVVTVDPLDNYSVMLPELPVTTVSQMQWYDDRTATWNTIPPGQYRWESWGAVYIVPGAGFDLTLWPRNRGTIQVTNIHGYNPIPQTLSAVCLQVGARLLANPYQARSTRTGEVQVTYGGAELSDSEKEMLGKFCLPGMA